MVISLLTQIQVLKYRSLNRLESYLVPRELGKRSETSPYLSCDSYCLKCDFQVPRGISETEFLTSLFKISSQKSIFIPGRFVGIASQYFERIRPSFETIIVGDDDNTQSVESLERLAIYSKRVFSVNLISQSDKIKSIPLGIESPSYRSGGRLRNFSKSPSIDIENRPLNFLIAWNNETNISKRLLALKEFEKSKSTRIVRKRIPAQVVHKLMRKTLFVPCPAGNGLDTHRIWESLYLGAIPLVLREDAFCGVEQWPILVIDDWEDVTSLSRLELENLYMQNVIPVKLITQKSLEILREISK
jgi:hypothetical protein